MTFAPVCACGSAKTARLGRTGDETLGPDRATLDGAPKRTPGPRGGPAGGPWWGAGLVGGLQPARVAHDVSGGGGHRARPPRPALGLRDRVKTFAVDHHERV